MASKKYLVPLNLLNLAEDPASASEGDVYYNTAIDAIKVYANGAWTTVGSEAFKTVSVSGQNNVVADSSTDTLTLVAGTNVSITTDDTADSITINSTGAYTSVDSITYPDYITFDTTPETTPTETGSLFWDSGDGVPAVVLNANVNLSLGQEQVALVKNATGASIAKGKVVYINGAQGQRPTITLSDADTETTSSKTFGLTAEAIADGAEGFVTTFGVLRGVNTDGLTEGAALWLSSTAGGYTTTIPAEPAHSVFLGYVVKANASSGEIFVNIQNGYELNELHGVTIENDGNLTDNEVLAYDSASGLWINQTAGEAGLLDTSATAQTKAGDLTITGNLTVNGTTTTINSTAVNVNNQVIFEGATANGFETTLTSIDPTADNTISLPDESGTLLTTTSIGVDIQAFDPGLSSIVGITGTGFVKRIGDDDFSIDTNTYVTSATIEGLAPLASPEFTGSPLAPTPTAGNNSTAIATTEFVATSFAPLNGPIFTGSVELPSTIQIGNVSGTEIDYLFGVTSNIQTQLDLKPTITEGVISDTVIPDTIARVSNVENSLDQYVPLTQKGFADGVATLNSEGKVPAIQLDLASYATLANPTFTGTVALPALTAIGDVSATEIGYLDGATSNLQTQISARILTETVVAEYLTQADGITLYQPKDGDLTAIAALTGTSGFLKKAGTDTWTLDDSTYLTTASAQATYLDIDDAINTYAPLAAPTFTGIVVLPSTTSIGTVSSTEIGYLDGVTSSIQTQLNGKQASHDHPYQTANSSLSSISALAGTAGFIKFDGGSTYTVDSNTYLVRNQPTVDTAIIAGTTTFSIANAIATTLNIGGAATAITIGSTNANAETIIRTPKINSNASSIQLFNTTSTTVEFAGAATTLHIGGTSTAGSTFNIAANATASGNQKTVNLATDAASGSSTVINIGTSNDGTVNVYGDVVIDGTIEVPTPTTDVQAANKGYVDALAAGINIKEQASYATTAALSVTYAAGTSDSSGGLGVGATITATANGALSPDGTEVVSGERVLVKNQTDAKQNGIYVVTDPGDGDSPFILTRAADFNGESTTNGIVKNGDYVFITGGSTNSNASFVISQGGTSTTPSGAIKFGTDSAVFSQYSGVPGNITSLGVVTQGVWQSTRIQKEYLDDELATLNNPTFTGSVTVPEPVVDTDAANKEYVDDAIFANAAALPDIIPIDDIRGQFNGIDSRFQPKFQGETLSILNPLRLLLSVNGIIQTVDFPEYVWQSFLPREGFMVDSDGYIAFSEVPPAGSTFDARLMPGPNVNSVKKGYPFRAVDILLGV